ncbi:hypothetical protein NRB20_61420 [Nocardia sp. RB20]|uniref:Uncharacterized protein n=1 Tax=Nocardia macrotermitis TaxID=2585198 RepID=A0A7K0DBB2_9NOCA|nr:hypothetical protein [Nocardia macrotermitis]
MREKRAGESATAAFIDFSVKNSLFLSKWIEFGWPLGGAFGGALCGVFGGVVKPPHPAAVKRLVGVAALGSGNPGIMPPQEWRDMIRGPNPRRVVVTRMASIHPWLSVDRFVSCRFSLNFIYLFIFLFSPCAAEGCLKCSARFISDLLCRVFVESDDFGEKCFWNGVVCVWRVELPSVRSEIRRGTESAIATALVLCGYSRFPCAVRYSGVSPAEPI